MARVVMALVCLGALVACGGDDGAGLPSPDGTAPLVTRVEPDCGSVGRLVLFMEPTASEAEIRAVETELERRGDVMAYEYLDQQAAYEEFEELFADSPDFVESVEAGTLPTSFRVDIDDPGQGGVLAVGSSLESMAGVREFVVACGWSEADQAAQVGLGCEVDQPIVAVFIQPDASPEEIEEAEVAIEEEVGGDLVDYLDKDAAYEEFREVFADSPEFVETIEPSVLPTSFRLWTSPDKADAVRASVEGVDGVREVVVAPC